MNSRHKRNTGRSPEGELPDQRLENTNTHRRGQRGENKTTPEEKTRKQTQKSEERRTKESKELQPEPKVGEQTRKTGDPAKGRKTAARTREDETTRIRRRKTADNTERYTIAETPQLHGSHQEEQEGCNRSQRRKRQTHRKSTTEEPKRPPEPPDSHRLERPTTTTNGRRQERNQPETAKRPKKPLAQARTGKPTREGEKPHEWPTPSYLRTRGKRRHGERQKIANEPRKKQNHLQGRRSEECGAWSRQSERRTRWQTEPLSQGTTRTTPRTR